MNPKAGFDILAKFAHSGGQSYKQFMAVNYGRNKLPLLLRLYDVQSSVSCPYSFRLKLYVVKASNHFMITAGNTKGGSITVPLTSCLTGF